MEYNTHNLTHIEMCHIPDPVSVKQDWPVCTTLNIAAVLYKLTHLRTSTSPEAFSLAVLGHTQTPLIHNAPSPLIYGDYL